MLMQHAFTHAGDIVIQYTQLNGYLHRRHHIANRHARGAVFTRLRWAVGNMNKPGAYLGMMSQRMHQSIKHVVTDKGASGIRNTGGMMGFI